MILIGILLAIVVILIVIWRLTTNQTKNVTTTSITPPKNIGDKWQQTKAVTTGIGTGLGWLVKSSIYLAILVFVVAYAIQGVQSVRDWEPATRNSGGKVTMILSEEWSTAHLLQNWKHTRWGIRINPKITQHGYWFRFETPEPEGRVVGQEIFVPPGHKISAFVAPAGDTVLRLRLDDKESSIIQANIWWQ